MQQTSFDTWEATYLFDTNKGHYTSQNITYETANIKQIAFSVTVPKGYTVKDPEYRNLATDDEGNVIVTKQLQAGETFHLTVTDDNKAEIKSIVAAIIIAVGLFGGAMTFLYSKIRKKAATRRMPKTASKNETKKVSNDFYSPLHSMILRINNKVPRKLALQSTVGVWVNVKELGIDYRFISKTFDKHMDRFKDTDLRKWMEIESQIKQYVNGGGFFVGRDIQEWFDDLERRFQ